MNSSTIRFKPIIGLEVHIELKTKSKMFCGCSAQYFGKPPNTLVCPVCLGLPGALPYPNQKAIEATIKLGLALNCQPALFSKFDRKNYFYPDLPKGYQISQYDLPLNKNGEFELLERKKKIRIRRVHLEEDTGKLIHQKIGQESCSLIDFNRSGVPLVEIVTEPDFNDSQEIQEFLKSLQQLVRWLEIADADMEKGQMRCEPTVNLEVIKNGKKLYTPLVELKNINSFSFVKKAIDYEIERQKKEFLKTGETKKPGNKTTRGWDEKRKITVLQREKEEASDYRYFPEPDIPPIRFNKEEIEKIKKLLPELPQEKRKKFVEVYHLSDYAARILTAEKFTADYFEETTKLAKKEIKLQEIANVIINKKVDIKKVSPGQLIKQLQRQKSKKKITIKKEELEKIINQVLEENQKAVADFKKGKINAIQFLIGQIMAKTKGQANPKQIEEEIKKKLKN
ncbi:MAG: Asp-tRNA(Asn)/Glu-tRNA(Gln) amidotransferase subunit GatB [Microgenomates group bacterium]